jgi:hypothetical protein
MPERQGYTAAEAALLREARDFLRGKIRELEALLPESAALRQRIERTRAYRRAHASGDLAQHDPLWDMFGTLETLFERHLLEHCETIAAAIVRPGVRHRRRRK